MTRLKQAWLALWGRLYADEIEAYLPSDAVTVTLYVVHLYDWKYYREIGFRKTNSRYHFYESCAQAHGEHPGTSVETVTAFKAGKRYFFNVRLREIEVEPKPKVAKGKRSGK